MRKLRQNASGKITTVCRDSDGVAAAPTGTPTVTVYKPDGTALLTAQNTTVAGATGVISFTLTPTQSATLGVHRAVWTATVAAVAQTYTTYFEVAGGFYFEVEEIRTFDNGKLADAGTYPNDRIIEARESAEDRIDQLCNVAFVPRGRRFTLNGTGDGKLLLPVSRIRTLTAATLGGTALTAGEITDVTVQTYGLLEQPFGRVWTYGIGNVIADVTYGYDFPPEPIRQAAMRLVEFALIPSNIDDRAISHSDESGTRQLAVPGRRFPTGIPDVDAVLEQFSAAVIA